MKHSQISKFYDDLIENIPNYPITSTFYNDRWCMVQSESHTGFAMMCPSHMKLDLDFIHQKKTLKELSKEISSFNFFHASFAMAAINCFYNQDKKKSNIDLVDYLSQNYQNKQIVSIGAFAFLKKTLIESLQVIEKNPKNNEYPDTASEYLIKNCDLILITGATIINKSFERLISLAKNKEIFLIGPSVPFYNQLFSSNIKLFGYTIDDSKKFKQLMQQNLGKKLLSSDAVKRLDSISLIKC
ncbi:MAG: hypothetical protein COB02_09680 [Candidatus Cloacimonadota bacterium]|nr:MAG: hypothetical protein COB02_09680 [Candidatus Cloacimonadota bacterium]